MGTQGRGVTLASGRASVRPCAVGRVGVSQVKRSREVAAAPGGGSEVQVIAKAWEAEAAGWAAPDPGLEGPVQDDSWKGWDGHGFTPFPLFSICKVTQCKNFLTLCSSPLHRILGLDANLLHKRLSYPAQL